VCGIFGLVLTERVGLNVHALAQTITALFRLSETRGREAAGLAVLAPDAIRVYKEPLPASAFVRRPGFRQVFVESFGRAGALRHAPVAGPAVIIGHSRLVTNGSQELEANNQPVVAESLVAVHNGIIVNDAELWRRFPQLQRRSEVDTEVLLRLVAWHAGANGSLAQAVQWAFGEIRGTASVAALFRDRDLLLLATNNGSLYVARGQGGALVFASESYILGRFLRRYGRQLDLQPDDLRQCRAGSAMLVDARQLATVEFQLGNGAVPADVPHTRNAAREIRHMYSPPAAPQSANGRPQPAPTAEPRLAALIAAGHASVPELRRCTRCILPETFPFIEFDAEGVCNYCRNYRPAHRPGRAALEKLLAPYRSHDPNRPDCIVAFSGGRDSSYGLHLLKTELGMNPVAFTYDWGLVTDLGRRNQARICGQLGIEHILISADIRAKRRNVRKNIEAWLKKPDLGMVPLFMAGDKQFFYYANKLRHQLGIRPVLFFTNPLEKTDFKTGFCGVNERQAYSVTLPLRPKLQLGWYYARQYLMNPGYLNVSLWDSLHAFVSSYFIAKNYIYPYHIIPWDEKTIESVLIREYDWETDPECATTWRIGDGTAAFYNHVFYTIAGFTENDTFRSNQVRAGLITRAEALAVAHADNQPRWGSIRWYANTIGFDLDEALRVINSVPKLYAGG
jgi:hypothetical protein